MPPGNANITQRAGSMPEPGKASEFVIKRVGVTGLVHMGHVSDHARAGAEYIVSAGASCLMHQQGCAERIGIPIKFIHIAQILNGASA